MKTLHVRSVFSVRLLFRTVFVIAGWLLFCGAFSAAPVASAAQERAPGGNPPEQENRTLFLPVVVLSSAGVQESTPPGNSLHPASPQLAGVVTPNVFFFHFDATGNLLARSDEAGGVVWRAAVRPFGQGTPTSTDHPLRFDGQPQEAELGGLYHLGARLYDPVSGRFLGPDPLPLANVGILDPQRFNRYAYSLNNPYRYADPTGYQPETQLNLRNESAFEWGRRVLQDPNAGPHTRLLLKESYLRRGEDAWVALHRELGHRSYESLEAWAKSILEPISHRPGFRQAVLAEARELNVLARLGRQAKGALRGKGGLIGAVIVGAIVFPDVAEAASQEKYGTALLEVVTIIWPRDTNELNNLLMCFGLCPQLYAPPQQFDWLREFNEWWSQELDRALAPD